MLNEMAPDVASSEFSQGDPHDTPSHDAPSQARVFYVRLDRHAEVEQALVAIMKRAAKKGLAGAITWRWGRAFNEPKLETQCAKCNARIRQNAEWCGRCDSASFKVVEVLGVDRIVLVVEGETPKYAGWSFLAALDHMSAEDGSPVNVLRCIPGADPVPVAFRTRGPACDHCKTKRRRGNTYVVSHEDGRTVQVGSTCIADFLGRDGLRVAALAEFLAAVADAAEDDGESYGGGGSYGEYESTYRLDDILPYVAAIIRHAGWRSRAQARDRGGVATADLAMRFRTIKRKGKCERGEEELLALEVEEGDTARAEHAIAWAETIAEDTASDYLHNVRTIARCNLVTQKTIGIAASVIAACEREEGKRAAEAAPKVPAPAYFGTPKKREIFLLTLVGVSQYDTSYGTTHVYRFLDSNGSTAVWKASSLQDLTQGTTYTIKATVKGHETYRSAPQTLLTRCEVLGEGVVSDPKLSKPSKTKKVEV